MDPLTRCARIPVTGNWDHPFLPLEKLESWCLGGILFTLSVLNLGGKWRSVFVIGRIGGLTRVRP